MKQSLFSKYSVLRHLLLMVGASIVILIVVFLLIKLYARQGKEYEMPEIEGKSYSAIVDSNALDLRYVVVDSVFQQGIEGGLVFTQDPKAGTKIKKGRKVYISVTRFNEEDSQLPEVTGIPLRQAVSQLANEGIQVGSLQFIDGAYSTSRIPPTVHLVKVKGKEVYAGATLPSGAMVDLVVERGDAEATTTVPFLLGKTPSKARRATVLSCLNVIEHYNRGIKDHSKAVVYRQYPEYTGVVHYEYGATVEVWYCSPDEVDVEQMIRDFKVDSSWLNVQDSVLIEESAAEDYIIQTEGWAW